MGFLWSDKIGGVVSVELVATFTGWLALNLGLNYYNKWVLSETDFRFPFFLTLVNKSVGLCVAITALFFKEGLPKPQDLAAQFSRPIVHAYGVMTALNIGMNNWSLLLITLTLNQIIKATIPLPTALLSKLVEGKTFSWHLYGSMAVLVGGVVMSSVGAFGAEPVLGIVVCLISVLSTAAWNVTSAVLMQTGVKLDAVSVLFVSGPTCIATLLFFFLIPLPAFSESNGNYYIENSEAVQLFSGHRRHPGQAVPSAGTVVLYLAISALMGSFYDIVHGHFVKITSAVNISIVGNAKLALLILLSMGLLEHTREPTPLRITGILIAFLATVWYSWFKLNETTAATRAKTADSTSSDEKSDEKAAPLVTDIKKQTESSSLLPPQK